MTGASNVELDPQTRAAHERRARLGAWILALGIAGILWGVVHMLGAVGGPEQADFAHRQRYDEVKRLVQQAYFGSLLRSVLGLFVAMAGGTIRRNALRALGRGD